MAVNRSDIIEKLKEILVSADESNRAKLAGITEQSDLFTDLGLNSVNMLYMVIATEEVFNIRFDDVGMNEFRTVGDVASYIEGKLK